MLIIGAVHCSTITCRGGRPGVTLCDRGRGFGQRYVMPKIIYKYAIYLYIYFTKIRRASYIVRIVCRRLSTFTSPRSPAVGSVRPRPLNHRGEQLPNAMVQLTVTRRQHTGLPR